MPVVIFIVLGIIVFIMAGIGLWYQIIDHRREQMRPNLKGFVCEYRNIGGMEKEYDVFRVTYNSGDEAEIKREKYNEEFDKNEITTRRVRSEVVYELAEYFYDNDINKWKKLEPAEEIALDAASHTVLFVIGGKEYSFGSDQKLPVSDALSKICGIITSYYEDFD